MARDYREKGDTWPKILKYNYEKYGRRGRAMRQKHYGVWQPYTWEDYYLNVKYLALGLLALDFGPGDKMMIIGDNAPEWYYAELAAQANRGVAVGLFSDLLPGEIEATARHCDVKYAVVEGQEQVDKLLEVRGRLPDLRKIVFWNYKGLAHYKEDLLVGFREIVKLGETYETGHPEIFETNVASGAAEDVCAIVHTAGTTGQAPKAAVHTYRSLRAGAEFLLELDPWSESDNAVPYLPPVWINEQWTGIGCHLLSACTLNFAEAAETQRRDVRDTNPSIVCYGARVWESQAATVQARIFGADALKRFAYRQFMPTGYRMAEVKYRRQKPGLMLKLFYRLGHVLLFRSIKSSLGLGNARICYSTGAMLSPEAFRFYHALNLPLKNLYGTTEGGLLAGAPGDEVHFESAGPPRNEAECRINDAGEIAYRQAGTFAGYYNDEKETQGVLRDGWFYSGDAGSLSENGHLMFVERAKDLVELSDGGKVAPQRIECSLRFSPYIKDAWITVGPGGAGVAAVIVIDNENVGRWAGQKRVDFSSFAALSQTPEVYGLVMEDIDRVNRTLPADCRVGKFVNLHREFDPDEGELTKTMNLRRRVLEKRYRQLLEAVFSGETVVPVTDRGDGGEEASDGATLRIEAVEGAAR